MMIAVSTALAIGSLVMKGVSAYTSHQAAAKKRRRNKRAAKEAGQVERRDITIRQMEEEAAISRQMEDVMLQADAAEGTMAASAAAAGVKGQSIQAILADVRAREGEAISALKEQQLITVDQLERMKAGATAKERTRIASTPRPNPWLTGLQIVGAGVDAYNTWQSFNRNRERIPGITIPRTPEPVVIDTDKVKP